MSVKLANDPIIVTGAARSGTTYLIQILNSHPDIYISNELRLFAWLHKVLQELPADEDVLYREKDRFLDFCWKSFPDLIRAFYAAIEPERRFWGDKNPHYLAPHFAGKGGLITIQKLFPRARFINIIRDGRDVVCSGMRGQWKDLESVHYMWLSHVRNGRHLAQSLPPKQYFELHYEELVKDDIVMAQRLFAFLQIPIDDRVLTFCQNQIQTRTPFCKPTRDIRSDVRASDWADTLSPSQKLRSLELLGAELIALGYETEASMAKAKRDVELQCTAKA